MSNRPVVYSKLPEKIRNRLYSVDQKKIRFLQVTNNLVNKGKTVCIIGTHRVTRSHPVSENRNGWVSLAGIYISMIELVQFLKNNYYFVLN